MHLVDYSMSKTDSDGLVLAKLQCEGVSSTKSSMGRIQTGRASPTVATEVVDERKGRRCFRYAMWVGGAGSPSAK